MKAPFGNIGGEFWLGLDNIRLVSIQRDYTLRVELEDWDGVQKYATYDHFRVGNEDVKYKLVLGKYTGDAGMSPECAIRPRISHCDASHTCTKGI